MLNLCLSIWFIISFHLAGGGSSVLEILGLNWFNRANPNSWFIYTILCFYVLFSLINFVFYKLKIEKFAPLVLCVIILTLRIVVPFLSFSALHIYVRSLECLAVGIVYASYKNKLDVYLKKFSPAIYLSTLFSIILGFKIYLGQILPTLVCLSIICFGFKFSYASSITKFLGNISLWIYLIHGLFISIFQNFLTNSMLIAFLAILCSIACSTLLSLIEHYLKKLFSYICAKIKPQNQQNFP